MKRTKYRYLARTTLKHRSQDETFFQPGDELPAEYVRDMGAQDLQDRLDDGAIERLEIEPETKEE